MRLHAKRGKNAIIVIIFVDVVTIIIVSLCLYTWLLSMALFVHRSKHSLAALLVTSALICMFVFNGVF